MVGFSQVQFIVEGKFGDCSSYIDYCLKHTLHNMNLWGS